MKERRKITVSYSVQRRIVHETFTFEYGKPGDYSASWCGRRLLLLMRDGWDESGRRVLSKTFARACTSEVFVEEEEK